MSLQGNYDQYVKTRLELEENQMKRFHWEQDQIAHMKVGRVIAELSSRSPRVGWGFRGVWGCRRRSGGSDVVFFRLFQNYIARFGHGSAKLARQAQSKEKTLQKMMASGLTERVVSDKVRSDGVQLGGLKRGDCERT